MSDESELAIAEVAAEAARQRLAATLVDIQSRINPRALARDALAELRETGSELAQAGLEAAKRNSGTIIGVGIALVLVFARDWFADIVATIQRSDATEPTSVSLKDEDRDTPAVKDHST